MPTDEPPRLGSVRSPAAGGAGVSALLMRAAAVAIGLVVGIAALLISAVVFAVVLGVAVLAAGVLWWRTRDLRRQWREAVRSGGPMPSSPGPGAGSRPGRPGDPTIIEGDFIREVDSAPKGTSR